MPRRKLSTMNPRLLILLIPLLSSLSLAQPTPPPPSPALKQPLDDPYNSLRRKDPSRASTRGDLRFNDKLRD